MPDTHARRRTALRASLAARDLPAALLTRGVNVRYLTGFTGSHGALLVTLDGAEDPAGRAVLATDGRYVEQAGRQAPDVALVVDRQVAAALVARAHREGLRRVGFEAHQVSVELHAQLAREGVELVPLGPVVEDLRVVKDDEELDLLRRACAATDAAFADLVGRLAPGRTERAVARTLEDLLRDHGADAPAFPSIVAAGPHSAVPHHEPTDRPLAAGDLLKLDFGARVGGYHADMTRTVVLRRAPAGWQREAYELVAAAAAAGRGALRAGAAAGEVDAAARGVVTAAGYGDRFPHGLGHGVGLEIHEAPLLAAQAPGRLRARTPVTVEPGVYLPGRGGVRIEDTLLVRDGEPEPLTTTTRELLVV